MKSEKFKVKERLENFEKNQKELNKEEQEILGDLNAGIGDFSEKSKELSDIATEELKIHKKIHIIKTQLSLYTIEDIIKKREEGKK